MPEIAPKAKYVRNVKQVVLGDVCMQPWFNSLYREDLVGSSNIERLYVCHRCFRYTVDEGFYLAHLMYHDDMTIPGRFIYKKDGYGITEVDGGTDWLFTTNISLFAKLFIDNKSVCFDVDTFLYYLLIDLNAPKDTPEIIGFFSKEKLSWDDNNLACIVVFPPWQRKGLGQVLMGASYEIGMRDGQIGGPEKPLSDHGERGYHTFWSNRIARYVLAHEGIAPVTVQDISEATSMRTDEIISTLKRMEILGPPRKNGSIGIQKRAVREWIEKNNIVNIASPVDPDAFSEATENATCDQEEAAEASEESDKAEPAAVAKPKAKKQPKKRKRGKKGQ